MAILSITDMVNVIVDMSPAAVQREGFNVALILGKSTHITAEDRIKEYTSLPGMIEDGFLTTDPEYKAAQLYFSATKKPDKVYIGVCASGETYADAAAACRVANGSWYGMTACGATAEEIQALGLFAESASPSTVYFYTTPFEAPTFEVTYSGSEQYTTDSTNGLITLTFTTTPETDPTSDMFTLKYNSEDVPFTFAYANGIATLTFTPVEETIDTTIFGTMQQLGFLRSHGMYSGQADAVAAVMGYAMGANTQANNSAYVLAYKSLPGVVPSQVTEGQVNAIKRLNGNIYITRGGKYTVYEQGTQASGAYFDEIIGVDTLVGNIQNSAMNLLVGSVKLPYTDEGMTRIINAITPDFELARSAGFIGTGVWTGPDISIDGSVVLTFGDMLGTGYTIFAPKVANVSQAVRETRVAPSLVCPVKLTGAMEHLVITIPVNK